MMQYSSTLFRALVAFSVLSLTTGNDCQNDSNNDITSLACSDNNEALYGDLCKLLRETGLDDLLGKGQFTQDFLVFAPSNTAIRQAGRLVGVNRQQKTSTLYYHIYNNDDLQCGQPRISQLSGLTSITMCNDDGDLAGQEGNVRIPRKNNNFPQFISTSGNDSPYLDACNGRIVGIGGVMGLGPQIYDYGYGVNGRIAGPGCSFNQKSCKGSKGGPARQQVGGLSFNNNIFYSKKGKGGWQNLNRYQSIYAHNARYVYQPYFQRYTPPYYYNGKKGKGNKGGYRYYSQPRGGVNGYGNFRANGRNGGFRRGLEEVQVDDESYDASEVDDDAQVESRQLRQRSAYEPEEYVY